MRLYFFNFYSELSKREQRLSLRKLLSLRRVGLMEDWRAAAWWLERQVSDEFGKTDRVEIGGTNGDAIKVQVEMGDLEDKIAKVLAIRKK
jgi:hypothetical protein